ncbi:MAG: hypothetical protein LUF33_07145 [Clostridiales bacterium]|nr:hypothetical protein [Clostridiales bacterium]
MKCPNCGFESETKFCPMCGTAFPLQGEEQQSNPYLNQSNRQAQPPTGENQPVQQAPQPIGENQPERQTPQPTGENQPVQQAQPNQQPYTQFNTAPSAPDSARYTAADFPEQKVKKDKKPGRLF